MIKNNKIAYLGIIACFCYFITTIGLILTGTSVFIVLMELATVLSTPVLLLLFMIIPAENKPHKYMLNKLSIIFMGAAFLASSFSVAKQNSPLKYTLLICGILCLIGLIGTVLVHANCWYIAPPGYGIGTTVICIELIILNKNSIADK